VTNRVVIKVCGITEERDAYEAVHLGVDALGFDFRDDSPRAIDPELARRIVDRLPVFVAKVGVFANAPLIRVLDTARRAGIGVLQFHGDETPATCAAASPYAWLKALRLGRGFEPEDLGAYPCTTYLVDARPKAGVEAAPPFEWRRARDWSMYGRIVIAGEFELAPLGMTIEDARPYGIDLLTEVEVAPGKKDLDRLELYVGAVRRAERRIAGEIP
jgi:phosphoribosylanthranilate isomerase